MREAHDDKDLIQWMCGAMETYKTGDGYPDNIAAMAKAIKRDLPTWEHVLIRKGEPWAPYMTPKARRGAEKCIADATAYIPFL